MATDQLEVEWQYAALDTRPVVRWLNGALPAGFRVEPAGVKELNDTYFDTAEFHINRAGYTCRVRHKGEQSELTLKAKAEASEGLRSRRELTEPLPQGAPSPGCHRALRRAAPCGRWPDRSQRNLPAPHAARAVQPVR